MRNGTSRILCEIPAAGKKKDIFSGSGKQPFKRQMKFLFDNTTSSRTSSRFTVDECIHIKAANIKSDETIHVMQYVQGKPRTYSPLPGKVIRLSSSLTNIFIGHPGQYQLVMSSPDMVGRVAVERSKSSDCDYSGWLKAVGDLI